MKIYSVGKVSYSDSFVDKMIDASKRAQQKYGISLLCIHTDSDARTVDEVMQYKFTPFLSTLKNLTDEDYCKYIVPTVPIQMIESWMLADKPLLKRLINAKDMSDSDLGIEKAPESYSNPKNVIENAIRKSMVNQSKKKRDQLSIADLYEILGNKLSLETLRGIPSFVQFEKNVICVFREMGLMQ